MLWEEGNDKKLECSSDKGVRNLTSHIYSFAWIGKNAEVDS